MRPLIWGTLYLCKKENWKNMNCNKTSFLYTCCVKNTICYLVISCIFLLYKYIVLCLAWYKPCRGSQCFSTYNLNYWPFSSCSYSAYSCYYNVFILFSSVIVHHVVLSTFTVGCLNLLSLLYSTHYGQT